MYATLVEQARQPVFYAQWGVPDSRDGRLEMVSLHAILLMRRLRAEGAEGRALAQAVLDRMFEDLDRHLREWGVGDPSVGKRMKELAQSFLGRVAALDPLLGGRRPRTPWPTFCDAMSIRRWRHRPRARSIGSRAISRHRIAGSRRRTARRCCTGASGSPRPRRCG